MADVLALDVEYSTSAAAELAGLPYMTLDRWERTGVVASTVAGGRLRITTGLVECRRRAVVSDR